MLLFPGALGDFVCFAPTLLALRARHPGRMLLVANPALLELVRPLRIETASIDRRAIADLFAPVDAVSAASRALLSDFGSVYSWTGFGDPNVSRHLAAITRGEVNIYRFRGMERGEHAIDYYARCAGVVPNPTVAPAFADDEQWSRVFAGDHGLEDPYVVIHPGSGSAKKNWQGFKLLIRHCRERYGDRIVLLCGPAESEKSVNDYGADTIARNLSLVQVASLLRRGRLYIGNDSGISHLAGAVGATGLCLFGPTDPATWAPRGGQLRVLHAAEPCPDCGPDIFCMHRLPVGTVIEALQAVNRAAVAPPAPSGGERRSS